MSSPPTPGMALEVLERFDIAAEALMAAHRARLTRPPPGLRPRRW